MFSSSLITALVDAADKNGIKPSRLLALVEVETSGKTFEQDGRTPALLYERHIAWRQAGKVSACLRAAFASAGLAIPKWSRATQYKDQGTSAGRLGVIAKARAIHEEVANQSASWGVGQTMGFLFEELGFASANDMVDHMTGNLAGQIECMIAAIRNKHLIAPLNAGQWATVARIYNGPGYAANQYDVRLADADKRWQRKIDSGLAAHAAPAMSKDDVIALQGKLRSLGYVSVGIPDGKFGTKTVGALAQFQRHEGLPVTGCYDQATYAAMKSAVPIVQPQERARATADDLANAGSKTIKVANTGGLLGKFKATLGATFLGGSLASHEGLLDAAQGGIDKANQAKGVWDSFCDLVGPLFGHPMAIVAGVILIASGIAVYFIARAIKVHRVADHNSGVHAGVWE